MLGLFWIFFYEWVTPRHGFKVTSTYQDFEYFEQTTGTFIGIFIVVYFCK